MVPMHQALLLFGEEFNDIRFQSLLRAFHPRESFRAKNRGFGGQIIDVLPAVRSPAFNANPGNLPASFHNASEHLEIAFLHDVIHVF